MTQEVFATWHQIFGVDVEGGLRVPAPTPLKCNTLPQDCSPLVGPFKRAAVLLLMDALELSLNLWQLTKDVLGFKVIRSGPTQTPGRDGPPARFPEIHQSLCGVPPWRMSECWK